MKERPILFSGEMVRALLAGKKTQTRREIKRLPLTLDRETNSLTVDTPNIENGRFTELCCPYGQPGDLLWVRESWQHAGGGTGFWYAATDSKADDGRSPVSRWRPSIHMPRDASRITLEITAVRVERLQDISEADAIAEGLRQTNRGAWLPGPCDHPEWAYHYLWDQINGAGSWDANPYVWVVEFKRIP